MSGGAGGGREGGRCGRRGRRDRRRPARDPWCPGERAERGGRAWGPRRGRRGPRSPVEVAGLCGPPAAARPRAPGGGRGPAVPGRAPGSPRSGSAALGLSRPRSLVRTARRHCLAWSDWVVPPQPAPGPSAVGSRAALPRCICVGEPSGGLGARWGGPGPFPSPGRPSRGQCRAVPAARPPSGLGVAPVPWTLPWCGGRCTCPEPLAGLCLGSPHPGRSGLCAGVVHGSEAGSGDALGAWGKALDPRLA